MSVVAMVGDISYFRELVEGQWWNRTTWGTIKRTPHHSNQVPRCALPPLLFPGQVRNPLRSLLLNIISRVSDNQVLSPTAIAYQMAN